MQYYVILDEDEIRYSSPSTPQILKCVINKQSMVPSMSPLVQQLIHDMLAALTVKSNYQEPEGELILPGCALNI